VKRVFPSCEWEPPGNAARYFWKAIFSYSSEHKEAIEMPQTANSSTEIVGLFHSPDALERAVSELTSAGWDRAELSLLGAPELLTPADREAGRRMGRAPGAPQSPVVSKDDVRQMRTLTGGLAGVVAAFAAAGATIMTGGAALAAIVGAAAAGGGAAAAVEGLGRNADEKREQALRKQLETGGILLWAILRQDADEAKARTILQRTGATDIHVQAYATAHRDKMMPLQ
jgi:hypothetical protein